MLVRRYIFFFVLSVGRNSQKTCDNTGILHSDPVGQTLYYNHMKITWARGDKHI